MVETITIFVLAIFVGYYVVWGGNASIAYAVDGGHQCLVIDHYCRCDDPDRWSAGDRR